MTVDEIARALAEPFRANQVKWRAGSVTQDGSRAQCFAYVDARLVQARLDKVVGIHNWQTSFDFLPSGDVVCTLRLRLNGEWIGKQDVGKPSKQPDAGDKVKAATSDSFKRAAISWGIGRYLYAIPRTWVPYDSQKKMLKSFPDLPEWATPEGYAKLHGTQSEKKVTSPPDQAWYVNVNQWLQNVDLAQEGELAQYLMDHFKVNSVSLIREEAGKKACAVFGRKRLEWELDLQAERTGMKTFAEMLDAAGLELPTETTITTLTDKQILGIIIALRQLIVSA